VFGDRKTRVIVLVHIAALSRSFTHFHKSSLWQKFVEDARFVSVKNVIETISIQYNRQMRQPVVVLLS